MRRTLVIISVFFAMHVHAKEITITSNPPKAEVKIRNLKEVDSNKIGETPFKVSFTEAIFIHAKGADIMLIEVAKEGYEPYRITIPGFIKSDVNLDVSLKPRSETEQSKKIDRAMNELFEAQRLIRAKNYAGAEKKIEAAEKNFPNLSITKELKASLFYLMNDYKKALSFYQEAYYTNTDNRDAYKMMIYLEKTLGVKKVTEKDK